MFFYGLQGSEISVYLDDIVIHAKTLEEHKRKCQRVFSRLREANLQLEPKKCQFLREESRFLGHVVGGGQIKPDPSKIEAVRNFPTPDCQKKVKSFLGLASYYRKFIEGFAKIAKPLNDLLKEDCKSKFYWETAQREAFETLKERLCSEPILRSPDFNEPFLIYTDASDFALGAVLAQGPLNKDHVVAYASRTLHGAELRYSTYERELLAIVFAVHQFRPYVYGKKFTVITDHMPLKWLHETTRPELRAHRLKAKLEGLNFDIIYRPGKKNANADFLSRNPILKEGEQDLDLPRLELYKLSEGKRELTSSDDEDSDESSVQIKAITTRGMKRSMELEQRASRGHSKILAKSRRTSNPEGLRKLIKEKRMCVKASSTPSGKKVKNPTADVVVVPLPKGTRLRGRPKKPKLMEIKHSP